MNSYKLRIKATTKLTTIRLRKTSTCIKSNNISGIFILSNLSFLVNLTTPNKELRNVKSAPCAY